MSEAEYTITVSFGHLTDTVTASFDQPTHAIEFARKRLVALRNSGRVQIDLVSHVAEVRDGG